MAHERCIDYFTLSAVLYYYFQHCILMQFYMLAVIPYFNQTSSLPAEAMHSITLVLIISEALSLHVFHKLSQCSEGRFAFYSNNNKKSKKEWWQKWEGQCKPMRWGLPCNCQLFWGFVFLFLFCFVFLLPCILWVSLFHR